MILPNKYTTIENSMIYQAAVVLSKIIKDSKKTIDKIWDEYNKLEPDYSYIYFIYLIEFMYISNMINYNSLGEVFNENFKSENQK